jgi:hypothetical protein
MDRSQDEVIYYEWTQANDISVGSKIFSVE